MKLGFAGAGMISVEVLKELAKTGGYEINAICATPGSEDKLAALCAEFGIGSFYTDYGTMLERSDTDTVYIAVPNHLHFSFCKKALDTGKHVICEKPFTSNYKEAEILYALAKEKGLIIIEAVSTRYLPNVLKIKEEIKSLGNIKIVSMNHSQYSSRYDAFKAGSVLPAFNPAMSGGALMDLNIYNINFAVMLFGEPRRVDYHANIDRGIDTSGVLTMDYGSFQCVSVAAKDCYAPASTSIQGDEGCILLDSVLNHADSYRILMNRNEGSGRKTTAEPEEFNYNGNRSRIDYEFSAFKSMICNMETDKADSMMQITLMTMKIQTEARKKAGIIFPADNA